MSSSNMPSSRASFCQSPGIADQSLMSLISEISCTDSDSLEQLDRENAHFSISESIIQVFEEIRWSHEQSTDLRDRPSDVTISAPVPLLSHSSHSSESFSLRHPSSSSPLSHEDEQCKQWVRIRSRCISEEDSNLNRSSSQVSLSDSETDPLNCSLASQSIAEPLYHVETADFMPVIKNWGVSLSNTSLFSREYQCTCNCRPFPFVLTDMCFI
jgi:hypothetical protein